MQYAPNPNGVLFERDSFRSLPQDAEPIASFEADFIFKKFRAVCSLAFLLIHLQLTNFRKAALALLVFVYALTFALLFSHDQHSRDRRVSRASAVLERPSAPGEDRRLVSDRCSAACARPGPCAHAAGPAG